MTTSKPQNGSSLSSEREGSTDIPLVPLVNEKEHTVHLVSENPRREATLKYALTEIPPIPVAVSIALQHVLVSISSALITSSVIGDTVCAGHGHWLRAKLFATTLFMQGACTITQTLVGVRLPVFQGPSSSFLVPLIALGKSPGWVCQNQHHEGSSISQGSSNSTDVSYDNSTQNDLPPLSMEVKLQQLSGSLMVASLVEVVIGSCGLLKLLLRYIGPVTVAPTIALIGLSLFKLPVMYAKYNPAIALGSAVLVLVFSLYMSGIQVPVPSCSKGGKRSTMPIFQLLPILLAMVVMWTLCGILTRCGVFTDDPNNLSYFSRTDAKDDIITNTPWFQITYPGQFGSPSFSMAATLGFSAAVISSFVESVGDYYAAAKCCQVMPPPDHAMSRGILIEGLGSVLSGAVGAAHATTSYSVNIAMLNLTKTASRSVLVIAGAILLVLSVIGKVGAALATLPLPILAGIMWVTLGILASLGMSTLKYCDMTSNRNLVVTGMAFLSGLTVPAFLESHGELLATGNQGVDQVVSVMLGTPMFLGGIVALILDNTAPGTDIERGLTGWRKSQSTSAKGYAAEKSPEVDQAETEESPEVDPAETEEVHLVPALTEDEIYAFQPLRHRLTSRVWKLIPFVPPNVLDTAKSN